MERDFKKYVKVQDILKCKRYDGGFLVPLEMLELKQVRGKWETTDNITEVIKNNPGKVIITKTVNNTVYYKIKD